MLVENIIEHHCSWCGERESHEVVIHTMKSRIVIIECYTCGESQITVFPHGQINKDVNKIPQSLIDLSNEHSFNVFSYTNEVVANE